VSRHLARCKVGVIARSGEEPIAPRAHTYAGGMQLMWSLSGLVQGLVGGVATLVILAARAALEGRSGVTFADLWTALAVGVATGILPFLIGRLIVWWMGRRFRAGSEGGFTNSSMHDMRTMSARPDEPTTSGTDATDRFTRFTDRARKVLAYAQDEALRFDHNYIGTEHFLLGLIREGDGTAGRVLGNLGVDLAKARYAVEFIIGRGDRPVVGEVGLTQRAKRVIELAIDESRQLEHDYIGTEHILLGLVREGEGIAAGVLESLGVNLDNVRHEVIRVIGSGDNPG